MAGHLEQGPVAILSRSPPIVYSAISFGDPVGFARFLGERLAGVAVTFLIFPWWAIDNAPAILAFPPSHQGLSDPTGTSSIPAFLLLRRDARPCFNELKYGFRDHAIAFLVVVSRQPKRE